MGIFVKKKTSVLLSVRKSVYPINYFSTDTINVFSPTEIFVE